jgi:aquaporin Z
MTSSRVVAEAVATALFIAGALSIVALHLDGAPTGAAIGAIVSAITLSPLGRISGAHLNPAVTLAFAITGRIATGEALAYVAAQFAGAYAGAVVFQAAWGPTARAVGDGVTHPAVGRVAALALEAGMTAALLAVVFSFLARPRLAPWTPLIIWPVIGVLIWLFGPVTGTSLNPARSAGPALVASDLRDLWLYFAAPLAGALAIAVAARRAAALRPRAASPCLGIDARRPVPSPAARLACALERDRTAE